MKYAEYDITFSEIPGHVSLTISLSGCDNFCVGCHSPHLREDIGDVLDITVIDKLVSMYSVGINSICLLGGDQFPETVGLLTDIRTKYPDLKLCLYSGKLDISDDLKGILDYYKVGPYIEKFGPLTSESTNQKMYKKEHDSWVDITHEFRKR